MPVAALVPSPGVILRARGSGASARGTGRFWCRCFLLRRPLHRAAAGFSTLPARSSSLPVPVSRPPGVGTRVPARSCQCHQPRAGPEPGFGSHSPGQAGGTGSRRVKHSQTCEPFEHAGGQGFIEN